ncbi:MAG: glycosyltransferase [Sandaracinus sp.]|nr:glycosyltransferase [Sandaracinus sp.]MCB9615527.1 glycosyltransferase [Sandaracinus sp.]
MRTLHVACLPFPSPQGTQAVLRAMVEALASAGHDTHLLTYAHGQGLAPVGVTHHRLSDFPRARSLRSGPSWQKVALDLRLVATLRRLTRGLRPDAVVAHGVEAAWVARAARVPALYYAHTRFDAELPTYASLPGLAALGRALDAVASAGPTVAITPDLGAHLSARREVPTLLPPWAPSEPPRSDERRAARVAMGLARDAKVVAYAGNLDGYQGWEEAAEAVARCAATFLVGTESDPSPLRDVPHRRVPLATEHDRRRLHAACDVVVVPRRAPGGLPIKLLDALARDVPVVAGPRALAGLRPDGVERAASDEADGLALALERALVAPRRGGRAWVAEHLDPARFVDGLCACLRDVRK